MGLETRFATTMGQVSGIWWTVGSTLAKVTYLRIIHLCLRDTFALGFLTVTSKSGNELLTGLGNSHIMT